MTQVLYGIKREQLIKFIIGELLAMAIAMVVIYNISWDHIIGKRVETCSGMIISTMEMFDDYSYKATTSIVEQIREDRDETVWVKHDDVNYRTGPNTRYASIGTLDEAESVELLGVTYNDWSLVEIDEEQYYIKSSNLTDDPPLITATGQKGEYQKYALSLMDDYGWAASEITPLINLWNRESGWNPSSHNKSSGAHGIPQALPASKMASEGSDYYTNGNTQIRWGLGYISRRYGSPSAAWRHFCSYNWY
ncbi:MAG: hypothetical protein IJH28_07595 [Mogibacterium sp.]|nr:hypothetical protein [Mogibacterium sp.]